MILEAIITNNVVKIYSGGVKALDGVSLTTEEGSSHALLGPNGAGKTTLIRIITTQIKPTSGSIKVLGFDVISQGSRVRELIGYVPQEMSLWTELSGFENMLIYSKLYGIPSAQRKDIIEELLEFMELRDTANRLVKTYSGGMIRRLEIAIALMRKPRVLILDEPTIGLDPRARSLVWSKLLSFKKEHDMTIFFATHYMDEAERYADKVTLLNRGKVIIEDSPVRLKEIVGGNSITIKLHNSRDRDYIMESLKNSEFKITILDEKSLSFSVNNISRDLPRIIEAIYKLGVIVEGVELGEKTLDDVFIALTGMRVEETPGRLREVLSTRRMIRRGG